MYTEGKKDMHTINNHDEITYRKNLKDAETGMMIENIY